MRFTITPRPAAAPLPADDGVPGLLRSAWPINPPPDTRRLEGLARLGMWLDLAAAELDAIAPPDPEPDPCDYAAFAEAIDNLAGVTNLWELSERARLAAQR